MMTDLRKLALSAALCAAAGVAVAQGGMGEMEMGHSFDPDTASPFAFAKSGKKAEMLEKRAGAADSADRVIGGKVAQDGAWPWQVALLFAGPPVSAASQYCGGSLIVDDWVLTAAHCVLLPDEDGNLSMLQPQEINVLVGSNVLAPGKGDVIGVEKIIPHPEFDIRTMYSDIALIKLKRAPKEGTRYETVRVPSAEYGELLDQPGVELVVTGWGLIDGKVDPIAMYQADVQMFGRDRCNATIMEQRANDAMPSFVRSAQAFELSEDQALSVWQDMIGKSPQPVLDTMVCSGTQEGGHDSCQGDSGGPLVAKLDDGSFIQAGLVSWGYNSEETGVCDHEAQFSFYTKVSYFADWLEQTINSN